MSWPDGPCGDVVASSSRGSPPHTYTHCHRSPGSTQDPGYTISCHPGFLRLRGWQTQDACWASRGDNSLLIRHYCVPSTSAAVVDTTLTFTAVL